MARILSLGLFSFLFVCQGHSRPSNPELNPVLNHNGGSGFEKVTKDLSSQIARRDNIFGNFNPNAVMTSLTGNFNPNALNGGGTSSGTNSGSQGTSSSFNPNAFNQNIGSGFKPGGGGTSGGSSGGSNNGGGMNMFNPNAMIGKGSGGSATNMFNPNAMMPSGGGSQSSGSSGSPSQTQTQGGTGQSSQSGGSSGGSSAGSGSSTFDPNKFGSGTGSSSTSGGSSGFDPNKLSASGGQSQSQGGSQGTFDPNKAGSGGGSGSSTFGGSAASGGGASFNPTQTNNQMAGGSSMMNPSSMIGSGNGGSFSASNGGTPSYNPNNVVNTGAHYNPNAANSGMNAGSGNGGSSPSFLSGMNLKPQQKVPGAAGSSSSSTGSTSTSGSSTGGSPASGGQPNAASSFGTPSGSSSGGGGGSGGSSVGGSSQSSSSGGGTSQTGSQSGSGGPSAPKFDPIAANTQATSGFNPLNPLTGKNMNALMGPQAQSGSNNGVFNAGAVNANMAAKGTSLNMFGGVQKGNLNKVDASTLMGGAGGMMGGGAGSSSGSSSSSSGGMNMFNPSAMMSGGGGMNPMNPGGSGNPMMPGGSMMGGMSNTGSSSSSSSIRSSDDKGKNAPSSSSNLMNPMAVAPLDPLGAMNGGARNFSGSSSLIDPMGFMNGGGLSGKMGNMFSIKSPGRRSVPVLDIARRALPRQQAAGQKSGLSVMTGAMFNPIDPMGYIFAGRKKQFQDGNGIDTPAYNPDRYAFAFSSNLGMNFGMGGCCGNDGTKDKPGSIIGTPFNVGFKQPAANSTASSSNGAQTNQIPWLKIPDTSPVMAQQQQRPAIGFLNGQPGMLGKGSIIGAPNNMDVLYPAINQTAGMNNASHSANHIPWPKIPETAPYISPPKQSPAVGFVSGLPGMLGTGGDTSEQTPRRGFGSNSINVGRIQESFGAVQRQSEYIKESTKMNGFGGGYHGLIGFDDLTSWGKDVTTTEAPLPENNRHSEGHVTGSSDFGYDRIASGRENVGEETTTKPNHDTNSNVWKGDWPGSASINPADTDANGKDLAKAFGVGGAEGFGSSANKAWRESFGGSNKKDWSAGWAKNWPGSQNKDTDKEKDSKSLSNAVKDLSSRLESTDEHGSFGKTIGALKDLVSYLEQTYNHKR